MLLFGRLDTEGRLEHLQAQEARNIDDKVASNHEKSKDGQIQLSAVNDIGFVPELDKRDKNQDENPDEQVFDKSDGTKQSFKESEKALSPMKSQDLEISPEKSESLQITLSGDKTQALNDQIENILAKQKQAADESVESSMRSSYVPIPPQSERYFKTHRSGQLQSEAQNQPLIKRSAMDVFVEDSQNISRVEGQKPFPSQLPTDGGGLGASHLGKPPVSSVKRGGAKDQMDDQTSESKHDFDGTHHLAYEDYRSAQLKNSMRRQAEAGLPMEMYMPVKGKNPFRRRKDFNERMKELNSTLLAIDRYDNFNALSTQEQIRWMQEEERAKQVEKEEAMAKEGYFEPVFFREIIPTQRQIAKAKHDANIAKAKKALARGRKSKIGDQLRVLEDNNLISSTGQIIEEFNDGSIKSELSSNKSYQFGRERSRQILNVGMGDKFFDIVIAHQNDLYDEQIRLQMERHIPLANWYMTKVLNRVDRIRAGEHLGDLVESELEDLEVDNDFELQRHQVENVSSFNNTEDDYTPRSDECQQNVQNVKAQVFSERVNYRQLGKSPPLSLATERTGKTGDLVQKAVKSEAEKIQELIEKIMKKMSHRILKIMIQKNCQVRIQYQQRLEKEARMRQQAQLSQEKELREQKQILQLQIVPLVRDLQAGINHQASENLLGSSAFIPSTSQQVLYQSHGSKRGSSQFMQHQNAQKDQLIEMSESFNYVTQGRQIFQEESKSEYMRMHTAQQLNYHGSQKYLKQQDMIPEVLFKKNRRSAQAGIQSKRNKTPSQQRPTQTSAERRSQKSIQSRKSTHVRQSSKSSEVFIKEDNEPSLGKNGSQKLLEQKSRQSEPENLETNQEIEFQAILAQGKEISESDLHPVTQDNNTFDDPRNRDLMVDSNEPAKTTQGPTQSGFIDLRQEGIMRRTPGMQGSFIDVDRSYELVNGMKQQIREHNSRYEHFEQLKSRDGSQVSKKNKSGENNLFNIDIDKNQDHSQSPTRQLNEIVAQHEIVPFDHSPEIEDKKKWKEVMEFMESNPQIMMNVLPPTPGRKFKQPPQNQEAMSQSRSRSPYGGPAEKQLNDGTSFGESFYDPQNNNLQNQPDDYLLDQTATSGKITRPATSANMTRFITPSQHQNAYQIGQNKQDRPSTTVNVGRGSKAGGPTQRIYGNVPDQLKNRSQKQSRAQMQERRLSALTNQNQNMTNAVISDDQYLAYSPPQSTYKFRNSRSKGQQNFLKTQQAYHSNTKMMDQGRNLQYGNKQRVLAAGVAPLPPKALQVGQQESQKTRINKLNQMHAGQRQSNLMSRPSTGMAAKSVEKQFYHQNVDINYIEKDLYIQDQQDSQVMSDEQSAEAQHARSKSLAQIVPNRAANNTQVMQLNENQKPLHDTDQQYGMRLQKKQRASSGWYRNGKIEHQQQQNAFFLKRNMQGPRQESAGYQIKNLRVNKQSFSGPKQFSMYQKGLTNVDSKAMIRMSKKDLSRQQANSIKQWPRVAESHKLLQSALKDVENLNENRPDRQRFERQLLQLNVSSAVTSPQARTKKPKQKIELPPANFHDFKFGVRESVLRLNPQVQRSMKHRPLSHRKSPKHSPSRSPQKDETKSRSKSGQKVQQMSQKKHKQHEKRLEKLQKLRKSMKNISSPRFQNKDSARQQSVRSKKQSPKKTDENYKVITQEKSVFDIRKAGPDIGTLATGSQGVSPRHDEAGAKEIETIPRQSIEQDQNNMLTPITQHDVEDVEDETQEEGTKKDFRSSKQKLSNHRRPSTVKQKRPSQQILEQEEAEAESPAKSFRQRQVQERRMSSSQMTEQTKGALEKADLEQVEKETGEREGTIPIDDSSNSSMTKKTIGIVDLRNSKEDSSKAVSFMMEPPSSHGFKRSRTGIEVNVEHPGPQLTHESRGSRSKQKKQKKKSPDSNKESRSSKKDRKSQKSKSPSRAREGSSSSYELRKVRKKKKRMGSGKEISDSKERKSSNEHHFGTMTAAGPGNVNQESAKEYVLSDDKNIPQFGLENIDFTKMSQDEIVKQFALQQQFFIDQYQEWQKNGMSPKSLQKALCKFQPNQPEQPTKREASQPQNVSQKNLNESLLEHKKSLDKASDSNKASLYTDYQDKLIKFDWSKTDIFQKVLALPRFKNPGITEVIEHEIMTNIHNLRKAPGHHQRAHILMPMFEQAMDYLEDLLCNRLHLRRLFFKIKSQYICIDYQNTLKLLVRAKLCGQLREDMTLVLCKYLDFMEELKQIQQLRDDPSSIKDEILKIQINKMQKHGEMFLQRAKQFKTTYIKVFKEGNIWVGDTDIVTEVAIILQKFGILQQEYNSLIP